MRPDVTANATHTYNTDLLQRVSPVSDSDFGESFSLGMKIDDSPGCGWIIQRGGRGLNTIRIWNIMSNERKQTTE